MFYGASVLRLLRGARQLLTQRRDFAGPTSPGQATEPRPARRIRHMSDTKLPFEQSADMARLALARGDRDTARASLSMALQTASASGTISDESPEALVRLGALYQDAGLTAEAERLFADAIAVGETTLGPDHPGVAPALARLGTALVARGALDDAEPLLTRALSIGESQLGVDHPDHNVLLNALSRLYLKQGAFQRAAPLLARLLEMKRVKGDDHPEVATVLASLALVRQSVGDHEGAEQLGRRVLQIRERTLAPNHYAIASALELLADACAARGKVGEALLHYQRALSIREQTLGVSHASLRVSRERIVDLQLQAAEEFVDIEAAALATPFVLPAAAVAPAAPAAPVALPPDAGFSLPPSLATSASRTPSRATFLSPLLEPLPAPVPAAPSAPTVGLSDESYAGDDEGAEHSTQSLVLPASTGMLSLHDEIRDIEQELNDAATATDRWSRIRETAAVLWGAIQARRRQAAIVGAAVVALFLVVRIAQPRTSGDASGQMPGAPGDETARRANALVSSKRSADDARNPDSPLLRSAAGSLTVRTVSTTSAGGIGPTTRGQDTRSGRDEPAPATENAPAVVLGHNLRPSLPNVIIQGADSIAGVAGGTPNLDKELLSKQFWTKGSDTGIGSEIGSATNAQLIGPMPKPYYPEFLRKNGIEGEVVVRFTVDESGHPDISSFEVVRSPHDALTDAKRCGCSEAVQFTHLFHRTE